MVRVRAARDQYAAAVRARYGEMLGGLEEQMAGIVQRAEAAADGTQLKHVVVVDAAALETAPRIAEALRYFRASPFGYRTILYGDSEAARTLRTQIARAQTTTDPDRYLVWAADADALATLLGDFSSEEFVTVSVLTASPEVMTTVAALVHRLELGPNPIELAPSLTALWRGLGFDASAAEQLAAGMEERQVLSTGT